MSNPRRLVLVCNSHIDPVWLWPWEEGLAATLATFRAAADLCDRFDGFVFCHNEALLYQWVETYEPALFARIRSLVQEQRWHVMGGWFLQPDCNLPSGESFVRHILTGRRYFRDKFGVEPRVAVNLDPFGHSRGLVQILAKSGYTGYLFCRPDAGHLTLPDDDFVWVGYDGSTVLAHRAADHYNSQLGQARERTERWLMAHEDRTDGLLLWGVGNHGGGPSRADLLQLDALMNTWPGRSIVHGTPEDYFGNLASRSAQLPVVEQDLNPWAVGCYTSMSTVKRAHRRLESRVFATERMLANCAVQDLLAYPKAELSAALDALLFCQFHDILPGSAVEVAEAQALQRAHAGLDLVDRLRAQAFFALLSGQDAAEDGEYPLFVHNPHPFIVTDTLVCEFQPPEPNVEPGTFLLPALTGPDGSAVDAQLEKDSSNIQIDQRKRLVFRVPLAAAATSRFSCRLGRIPFGEVSLPTGTMLPVTGGPPPDPPRAVGDVFRLEAPGYVVDIDGTTGLLRRYCVAGVDYLQPQAFRLLVIRDSADPWGMRVRSFRDVAGELTLLTPAEAATFAGVSAPELAPVRIIEDGPVRTVVEALFGRGRSAACLRYVLPKNGTEIALQLRVSWFECDTMLKLAVPTTLDGCRVHSQVAYGVETHTREAEELVGQTWLACVDGTASRALTVINDGVHGFDYAGSEIRLSLLRSPAHAGHPVGDGTPVVRQDRYEPRVDRGDHTFQFWLNAGPAPDRLGAVEREAGTKHDGPMVLNAFPAGRGKLPQPGPTLSDGVVQLSASKLSEDGRSLVLRLFEPTGTPRRTTVRVAALGVTHDVDLGSFEVRTLAINLATGNVVDVDLLERRCVSS